MLYVVEVPAATIVVLSVLVIDRSACRSTPVVSVAEVLPGVGSVVVLETVAVLDRLAVRDGSTFTTSVSVIESPGFMSPRLQFTVPAAFVPPWSAETKLVPAGTGSDTVTERATDGPPLFVTTIV